MPTLIVTRQGDNESDVKRFADEEILIGRHSSNHLQLKSGSVSRHHAKILTEGDCFFLLDMGSGNGTVLNGITVKSKQKNLLQAGDVIAIDEFSIQFQPSHNFEHMMKSEEVTESDILEVKLLKKVLSAMEKDYVPSIEVLNGSAEGKKFLFTDEVSEIVIGRDPECDLPVTDYVISRRHARITKRWGGIAIRDLESKNGTFLNNRRVVEEYLHDGDRIALGTIVIIFRNPQEINLANFEDIKPKYRPADVKPEDIPAAETETQAPELEAAEEQAAEEGPEGAEAPEEQSAVEEWEKLDSLARQKESYPTPEAIKEKIKMLTPLEIGMVGLGVLVFIFALITIVNLITA